VLPSKPPGLHFMQRGSSQQPAAVCAGTRRRRAGSLPAPPTTSCQPDSAPPACLPAWLLQMGEIPPDSTLDIDVELLSIKTNPLGYRTKLIEG
jgi:hypothetical protein